MATACLSSDAPFAAHLTGPPMNTLLNAILEAHGGMDRWSRCHTVEATIVSEGGFFPHRERELPVASMTTIANVIALTHFSKTSNELLRRASDISPL